MSFYDTLKLQEKKELLMMLARQPHASLEEIAKENGLHRTTLSNLLYKHEISIKGVGSSKESRMEIVDRELEDIEKIIANGWCVLKDEIKDLKCSIETLNERLRYEMSRKWYHKLFGI